MASFKHRSRNHNGKIDLLDDIENIKAAFMTTSYDVKDKTSEMLAESIEALKERTASAKDSLEAYTSEKPLKTIGISLLVGVAIGFLLRK
jgi:ElaB/YqjD/DUF883 family membrane-anchored ribosome-binding protein